MFPRGDATLEGKSQSLPAIFAISFLREAPRQTGVIMEFHQDAEGGNLPVVLHPSTIRTG